MSAQLSLKPASSSSDILRLWKIYDAMDINTGNLVPFHINMDHYGPMLVSVLPSKLPENIKIEILRHMPTGKRKLEKRLSVFKQEFLSLERFSSISQASQNNYSGEYSASVSRMFRSNEKLFGYRKTFFGLLNKIRTFQMLLLFYYLKPMQVEIICILSRTDLILTADELQYYLSRRIYVYQILIFLLRRSNSQQLALLTGLCLS